MEFVNSVFLGIGLSAACGLRVFLPVLATAIAASTGLVVPSAGFLWIGSMEALAVIALLAAAESLAYHVAGAGRFLSIAATPAAMVAGTMLAAAALVNLNPVVGILLPLLTGGAIAGLSQSLVTLMRVALDETRGALLTAVEAAMAFAFAALSILFPLPAGLAVAGFFALRWKSLRDAVSR